MQTTRRPETRRRLWLALGAGAALVILIAFAGIGYVMWRTRTATPPIEVTLDEMKCTKPDVQREYWRDYLFITTRTLCDGKVTNPTDTTLHVELEASIANRKMGEYLGTDTDFVEVEPGATADFTIVLASLMRSEMSMDEVRIAVRWARDRQRERPVVLNCENWKNTGSVQIVCKD